MPPAKWTFCSSNVHLSPVLFAPAVPTVLSSQDLLPTGARLPQGIPSAELMELRQDVVPKQRSA